MLSESSLREISHAFCGDTEGYYEYKTGPKLISFFNGLLKKKDVYQSGFPSRWAYVYNNLVEMLNANQIDKFFTLILGKQYIMQDLKLDEVKAIEKSNEFLNDFNRIVKNDLCSLTRSGTQVHLVKNDNDLVLIGSGGFANVYKQKSSGKILKKLKEDYVTDSGIRSRFKREYNITKSLDDIQGIIEVYDYFDDNCSYTMEQAESTLQDFILSNDLPESNKITCIRQILHIMSEVHKRDIIHRDISANNIFILSGMLKIADFGLGKDLNMFASHQTVHTNAFGQIRYCAPEQFMLLKDGDKRSDVYSLGKLISFILTGNVNDDHHFLRSVVEKATNTNIAFRYADASELLAYVEKGIKFHQQKDSYDACIGKIKQGIFDEDVESFLYEQSGDKLCNGIIDGDSTTKQVYFKFMEVDNTHAEHMIAAIEDNFRDVCTSWTSYDPVANFAYNVLMDNYSFVVKEMAANILRYVAFDVNRFNAQKLVESALGKGIEPLLEDILRN